MSRPYCQVVVDGIPWVDSGGDDAWPEGEAIEVAALCEEKGYDDVRIEPV